MNTLKNIESKMTNINLSVTNALNNVKYEAEVANDATNLARSATEALIKSQLNFNKITVGEKVIQTLTAAQKAAKASDDVSKAINEAKSVQKDLSSTIERLQNNLETKQLSAKKLLETKKVNKFSVAYTHIQDTIVIISNKITHITYLNDSFSKRVPEAEQIRDNAIIASRAASEAADKAITLIRKLNINEEARRPAPAAGGRYERSNSRKRSHKRSNQSKRRYRR